MNTPKKRVFISQIRKLQVDPHDPYIRCYPSFVRFFDTRPAVSRDDFVVSANFAYGWMPRMLSLRGTDADWTRAGQLLTRAKNERMTVSEEILFLMRLVNNSLVGVSKLLHFVNPKKHAIWDSRVYSYLTQSTAHGYRMNNVSSYFRYLTICDEISSWPETSAEVESLSRRIVQNLTPFRAIELTMFEGGAQ